MNDKRALFVTDEDVPGRILRVIRDARKYIVLVTPYLDLWDRAEQAIKVAVRNGVAWLIDNGVRVLAVDDLHAKIYMNEESVVLSSMNLTHGSTTKSLDFAVVLQDEDLSKEVRDYVSRTVGALADEVKGKGKVTKFFNRIADAIRGHCIRCGRAITKNPDRPLCDDCYDVWAEYENSDFQEKVCHSCGEPAPTSYAKPLCAGCYRSAR
jgi:phosphatidylserine/phosphatidylglycerophosphate/cardiolipin synthase-like enzyme